MSAKCKQCIERKTTAMSTVQRERAKATSANCRVGDPDVFKWGGLCLPLFLNSLICLSILLTPPPYINTSLTTSINAQKMFVLSKIYNSIHIHLSFNTWIMMMLKVQPFKFQHSCSLLVLYLVINLFIFCNKSNNKKYNKHGCILKWNFE